MIRVGLDTNILAYLVGVDRDAADRDKINRVRRLLADVTGKAQFVVPTQALGELFAVLIRTGAAREVAKDIVLRFHAAFEVAEITSAMFLSAMDLAVTARFQIWDALIVNAAAEAGCAMLWSEDMQDGSTWRGMTVINPLSATPHPKLAGLR